MFNKIVLALAMCLLCTICANKSAAQTENGWINYNQTYYKIKVAEDGMYRITRNVLVAAGIPATSIDPRRFQIFHNGIEQAIHVEGQADGAFDANDYIEFYGRRNDGTLETKLYRAADAQPHTFHSLFSDSSVYFLTWHLTNQQGKRRTSYSENNVSNIAAESWHNEQALRLFTSQYHEGRSYQPNDEILIADYDYAEHWTGNAITRGQSTDVTISNLTATVPAAGKPRIEVMLAGRNNNQHSVDIRVGPAANALRVIGNVRWGKDEVATYSGEIEWTDISATGSLLVRVTAVGVDNTAERISVSYVNLIMPQSYDMGNASRKFFNTTVRQAGRSYIEVANAPVNCRLFDVSDPHNIINVGVNNNGNTFNAIIRNTNTARRLLATSAFTSIQRLQPVSFRRMTNTANYLIVSHPALRSGSGVTGDPVQAYANYRASATGGGYSVFQIDIEELYDQFGYGIPTPAAIRNFAAYYLANGNPKHLFLIGKGISPNFNFYRLNPATNTLINFVPTYGFPGGDEPFTAGLKGNPYVPAIPTGRLNARTALQVRNYLNKVIEMEAQPYNALWRKDLIHLSGGNTISEQLLFLRYVQDFQAIAEGKFLAGAVVSQRKQTTDAVEFLNIASEVNSGKSLITFFGHSGTFATDIDIGLVSDPAFGFSNKGKYPVMLVNGCNAGDLYSTATGFGEDWIHTADRGALAFMAHSKQAFSNTLRRYTDLFYRVAFASEEHFGLTLGEVRRELASRYYTQYGINESSISQVEQFVLLGDPAVKVFAPRQPDYAIDAEDISISSFDGGQVTASVDSFLLKIPVLNFGKYTADSVEVRVVRVLRNGQTIEYPIQKFPAVGREGEWLFVVRNSRENENTGANRFQIIIDPANKIPELDNGNNSTTKELFIAVGSTANLFPTNFGVENTRQVKLIVQSSASLANRRGFRVEIDTTSTFNSPFLRGFTKEAIGIASFDVDLGSIRDSTVIYWRSRFTDPQPEESPDPTVSSFTYIPSIDHGWTIRHEGQYANLITEDIERDPERKVWKFEGFTSNLSLVTHGAQTPGREISDIQMVYNDLNYIVRASPLDVGCRNNTINMVAFNRESTVPYKVLEFGTVDVLNPLVCGRVPQIIFNFTANDITGGNRYMNRFMDATRQNDYILVFTIGSMNFEGFSPEIKNSLLNAGVSPAQLATIRNGKPFIILGRKGAPSGSAIVITNNTSPLPEEQQVLLLNELLNGTKSSGSYLSPLIGPATTWGRFHSNMEGQSQMSILGTDNQGRETTLFTGPTAAIDLSFINPVQYPYLRVRVNTAAGGGGSPAQMKSWLLAYRQPPEGVLITGRQEIAALEGMDINSQFTYWNIGKVGYSDSIVVNTTLRNNTTRQVVADRLAISAPAVGDSVRFTMPLRTQGMLGRNSLSVSALPKSGRELYTANNILSLPGYLNVVTDTRNPLLDVAFDGMYIMDGDIVSPSPRIVILVKDDNPLLLKKDTAGVNISLRRPCEGCNFERVALSGQAIKWEPATEDRDFRIEYTPGTLPDGIYGLRVQATDASGNPAGTQPYEINFEVVNESAITHFYPYPNPFSTSTRFVFTLTGSEVPDEIKIQIMTVTGRVVREIMQDEIGPIRIGNNVSEYAWNGTDEFGDQLANGVYLYRVITRLKGQTLDHRSTIADKGFKQGYGKIYILR